MPSYVLKRKKNYYKRVWEDWTQPALTANGTMGGESFAVNQSSYYADNRKAWVAFDGVDSTGVDWNSAQGVPQWISWYNPVPLSISKITVVNTIETAYPDTIKDYEVQVSDDNSTWTTIYSGTNTTGVGETWDIDLSNVENSSKYWRIYITSCNNRNYARIVELKITAKVQRIVQVNLGGGDVWEDFKQPVLKANGVVGGDKFAVTEVGSWNDGHPAYYAFNDDSSDTHSVFTKSSGYFIFYNPRDLIVTKLTIRNATGDGWGTRAWTAGTVSGSNDGVNFEEVTTFTNSVTGGNAYWDIDMSANTKGYRYYKIIVTATSYANSGAASQCTARNIQITAKELTRVGGDDYDFMGDNQSYIFKRKINKYYKDTVTTKYWKEVETTVVEYAGYTATYSGGMLYHYVKIPVGSENFSYIASSSMSGTTPVSDSSQLKNANNTLKNLTEESFSVGQYTFTRNRDYDLARTTTTVVEGTPDDYTYTTTETESVEVSANDDYDRVVVDSEPSYFLTQRGNWQPIYEDYTLPKMTSRTAPEGAVSTNIGNGEYTIDAYNFFFNRNWYFEAEGREGSRYNRYTFAKPLKPDTYTISFGGNLQQQDSNSGTLSVWYDDGTVEELISYTLSTAGQTFSKTFTATKPIRTISIDMTVSRRDNKNDVTTFYGLNIVSETGQLQVFTGYKQDKE